MASAQTIVLERVNVAKQARAMASRQAIVLSTLLLVSKNKYTSLMASAQAIVLVRGT
jgi:hypothetical protein